MFKRKANRLLAEKDEQLANMAAELDWRNQALAGKDAEIHRLEWAHDRCLGFLHVHGWDWERVMKEYPGVQAEH